METLTEENKQQIRYAGFWLRFAAYIIDQFLLKFATALLSLPFILSIIFTSINMSHFQDNSTFPLLQVSGIVGSAVAIILIRLVTGWLYYAIMQSSKQQATLGKMAVGAIVTDLQGNSISFGRATGRYFSKLITDMTMYIGYILAGLTEKKQALHDMIAGTLVIRKNAKPV